MWNWVFILFSAVTLFKFTSSQPRVCLYQDLINNVAINMQHQLSQVDHNICTACLPTCRSCSSAADESCGNGNCQSKYYYNSQRLKCQKCPKMCEQCSSNTNCAKCIQGFYLDNAMQCKRCPAGVSTCTSSSILQCLDGYFYDPQTYTCRKCSDANCQVCSSKASCDSCMFGFILNTGATACLSCGVTNCLKCLSAGVCQNCSTGYKLVSSNSCAKYVCDSVRKCKQCTVNASTNSTTCLLCQSGYFLLNNRCNFGSSIMCEYSLTPQFLVNNKYLLQAGSTLNLLADYGSCASCNLNIAQLAENTNTFCIPKTLDNSDEVQVDYYVFNKFVLCNIPYLVVSELADLINFSHQMKPAYQFSVDIVAVVIGSSLSLHQSNYSLKMLAVSVNLDGDLVQSSIKIQQLYCASPTTLPANSIILKLSQKYKVKTDYRSQQNLSDSSTVIQSLDLNISLNKNIQGLQNAKIAGKQLYLNFNLCKVQNCLQCMSASTCTKCVQPFLVQNYECVKTCDIGYYQYYYQRPQCLSQCPAGFYIDVTLNFQYICRVCADQCTQCYNKTVCSKCKVGYYLTVQGYCQTSCQNSSSLSKYYPNSQSSQCQKCQNPCKTCSLIAKNCTSCLIGFQFNSSLGVCLFDCPIGFYSKVIIESNGQTNPKCISCSRPCRSCQIQGTMCTSCIETYYLYQNSCVLTCPSGYFNRSYPNNSCQICNNPCKQCSISQNNCTSCKYNTYVISNQDSLGLCISQCPKQFYYMDTLSFKCRKCSDKNCLQCRYSSSSNLSNNYSEVCVRCLQGFVLSNSKCLSECLSGWQDQGKCQKCPYPCDNCSGTGINNYTCTSCLDKYFLQPNGKCLLLCSSGFYGNWSSKTCSKCPNECIQCTLTENSKTVSCISCSVGSALYNSQCLNIGDGCPQSTYISLLPSPQCLPCLQQCLECKQYEGRCTKCPIGKFLLQLFYECVDECPYGYLNNLTANVCIKCQGLCSDCLYSANNCTNCKLNSYKYYNKSTDLNVCLQEIQCGSLVGLYADNYYGECRKCLVPCVQCTSQLFCTKCDNSTYLFKNACVFQCSNGYYPQNRQCKNCPQECFTCFSNLQCYTCKPNYFFRCESFKCLAQCLINQYKNPGSMTCQACKYPCQSCQNTQYCLSCQVGSQLVLLNGKCLQNCPVGHYQLGLNKTRSCNMCESTCQICLSPTNCTSCRHGYFFYQNKCLNFSMCPQKYYADYDSRMCSPCRPPCLLCLSKYQCLSCISTHFLKDSYCYMSCPIGLFAQNNLCTKCTQNCIRCSSLQKCFDCANHTFLYTNLTNQSSVCLSLCPEGSYNQISEYVCQSCISSCKTCSMRSNNCTSCNNIHVLQNYRCVEKCSNFYYETKMSLINSTQQSRSCEKCNSSCLICINFQICQVCESSYLVLTNAQAIFQSASYLKSYCSLDCPLATYKNSQTFICQPCQQGCKICSSFTTCLQCSSQDGFILYNIHCIYGSCPENLYTIVDENKCVEQSYCRSHQDTYFIYPKLRQCFRKDLNLNRCPKNFVLRNSNQCIDYCTQGFVVNFEKVCIKDDKASYKNVFNIYPIFKNGYIQVMIGFSNKNIKIDQNWSRFFQKISIKQQIDWKQSSRLLISPIQFKIIELSQLKFENILVFNICSQTPIQTPTDFTLTVEMTEPFSGLINIDGLPLQNWQSQYVVNSYMITQEQIDYQKSRYRPVRAILMIIVIVALISILNLIKSGKIYLLASAWDFMNLLYIIGYLNVHWPINMRLFLDMFSITWLRLFAIPVNKIVFSPKKVHSNSIDMHLFRNITSNLVLLGATLAILIMCLVTKKIRSLKTQKSQNLVTPTDENRKQQSNLSKSKNNKQTKLDIVQKLVLKIMCIVTHLSLPNIVYFSLLNISYKNQHPTFNNQIEFCYVLSILLVIICLVSLIYVSYKQIKQKNYLDQGINPLKKIIIICLPIYLSLRKFAVILFVAIMNDNAAFPVSFVMVTTAFIFILICWFQPYNNKLRHRITLLDQGCKFIFFLFVFVYVCNQREMMSGSYYGILIALAVGVIIVNLIYPSYHLYKLLNLKNIILRLITKNNQQKAKIQLQKGVCIEQINYQTKLKSGLQLREHNEKKQNKFTQQNNQDASENSCTSIVKNHNQNINGLDNTRAGQNKKIIVKKEVLIQGQTDHQADQSEQQGDRRKMKLADYTVRLTKRAQNSSNIKQFKNYEFDDKNEEKVVQNLVEKEIQLCKLIQRQRALYKANNADQGNN